MTEQGSMQAEAKLKEAQAKLKEVEAKLWTAPLPVDNKSFVIG